MPMIHGWRRCRFHACQEPTAISTVMTSRPSAPRTVLLKGDDEVDGAPEDPPLVRFLRPWTMPTTVGLK